MKKLLGILLILLSTSCNKENLFDGPDSFNDDFESYQTLDEMLFDNDVKWSFTQNTYSGNLIEVDSSFAHTGSKSMHFKASKSTNEHGASKASIAKQNMAFWENEILVVEGWYFLAGNDSANWLFLLDLEEQTAIGAGPGMRLALVNGAIRVEHKYNNPDILQLTSTPVQMPRNQWVHIKFESKLAQKKKGYVKVWQDDVLIIDQSNWKTLPKDILYFQQGTKGMYSSIEFGITANTHDSDMEIWVDDIQIWKK